MQLIKQYVKKPAVIDALIWDGTDETWTLICEWLGGEFGVEATRREPDGKVVAIHTLEGVMNAQIGDYIIKGIKDEFYPCKPDIFAATYEEVSDGR